MRFFKYLLLFVLPILLFLNLWRLANGNDDSVGFRFTMEYVSTYRGWQNTVDMFDNIYSIVNVDNAAEGILVVLSPIWAPVAVLVAIIADIIYHIGFFFGWIGVSIFGDFMIEKPAGITIQPYTDWPPNPIFH